MNAMTGKTVDAISKPKRKATSGTRKGNRPGKGPGWGGERKGADPARKSKLEPFEPGNQAAAGYHTFGKSERLEKHREMLWTLGMEAENEMVRVTAIRAYADREEGMPLQKTVNEQLGAVSFIIEK
jgi:hypothetical protein